MNFSDAHAHVALGGRWVVEVDSAGEGEGGGFTGRLGGDAAVVLRPG